MVSNAGMLSLQAPPRVSARKCFTGQILLNKTNALTAVLTHASAVTTQIKANVWP
jgi:hypothetical protein